MKLKKSILFIMCLNLVSIITITATPYAGSYTGGGQAQIGRLRGHVFSPDRWTHGKRRFQGRVLKMGPSRNFYYKRERYIQNSQDPSTVHSRP